jgi:hypothetical protein
MPYTYARREKTRVASRTTSTGVEAEAEKGITRPTPRACRDDDPVVVPRAHSGRDH